MTTETHAKLSPHHVPSANETDKRRSKPKAARTLGPNQQIIQATVQWSRSWDPHVYLTETNGSGRMGWAEVPFKATPLPVNGGPGTDDDGTGHGARLAAILAAVEAAGKPGFIVIDTTTYSPVGANGPDDPGWFGTVIDVSVSPTQY